LRVEVLAKPSKDVLQSPIDGELRRESDQPSDLRRRSAVFVLQTKQQSVDAAEPGDGGLQGTPQLGLADCLLRCTLLLVREGIQINVVAHQINESSSRFHTVI